MPLDLVVPADFPVVPYESVRKRVSVDLGESHSDSRREFAGGWNGLRYRYLACSEYDRDFTLSIQQRLTHLERYHQERDLFGFFVTGQSAIECLCYSLYAVASIMRPIQFPVQTMQDLVNIEWRKTTGLFSISFPGETLTNALDDLAKSSDFSAWRKQRNILAHRATPGRVFNHGGPQNGVIEWSGIHLDRETTITRRQWLSTTITAILIAADSFTAKHLSARGPIEESSE
jgi:hypothetical protein